MAVSGEAEQHNKDTGQRQAVERKVDVDVGEVVALDEDHHVEVAGEIGVDRLVVHCHDQRLSRSEPVGGFFSFVAATFTCHLAINSTLPCNFPREARYKASMCIF